MPLALMPPTLGFIGFGEAGSRIALGLRESGFEEELFAYDIADSAKVRAGADAARVTLLASNGELVS